MGRLSALNMLLSNSILRQVRVRPNPLFLAPRFASRFMSEQARGTFLEKSEVTDRVVTVVKAFQKVDPSKVSPHAHFHKDLGLDSLDSVELVMALEEEFSFEIPDKDADKIESITNAIDYIASHPEAK